MLLGTSINEDDRSECKLSVSGSAITYTKLARYIGVYIDNNLKFDIHVNRLTAKPVKLIGWLGRLGKIVPKSILCSQCCIYFTKPRLRMYHMEDNENQYKTRSKTTK